MDDDTEETRVEQWTYAGMRLNARGERQATWIGADGKEHRYTYRGASSHINGSIYEVKVDDKLTMHGKPSYVGQSDDFELRGQLRAGERAADLQFDLVRRQRQDKQNDPLNDAIDAVARLISSTPYPQRPGVINYVMYRLNTQAWR